MPCEVKLGKTYVIPITAILLLLAMPAYFAYVNNMKTASDNHDVNAMTENFTEYTFDTVKGELIGKIVLAICGVIAIILGFVGIKAKFS